MGAQHGQDDESDVDEEAQRPAVPRGVHYCDHACDLAHGCCLCVHRKPRPGLLAGLENPWFARLGLDAPDSDACQFFCGTCAASAPRDLERLPLPFGGVLLVGTEYATEWHLVEISGLISECDTWSEAALSSDDGSWV